ncbi:MULTISPECIES: OmpH family outer membrane protein [Rufibacter]|uniref:Outer membrane protein n=1 Tax=Rufibacter quisquiliarum TaxID=1549639 RepID=A0A839GS99_9BACT|nr:MULTISPECIES: OmpH family outer membrane protein [Rufibacter]MBA9077298.1 outer membrane protein [Rufibacter quisquiliarum]
MLALVAASTFAACKNETPAEKPASAAAQETTAADDSTATADPAGQTLSPAQANPEIVYINSDSLLTKYQFFKDVKSRLEAKAKRLDSDFRSKGEAFQREVGQFQQQAAGMTQEQRASTEQRLGQKQQQLAAQQQSAGNQLANDENEEMKKIYEKVESYLKKLSADRGYKMVLTYTRGNSAILYGDKSLDITTEVIKGLNEEYAKTKKK